MSFLVFLSDRQYAELSTVERKGASIVVGGAKFVAAVIFVTALSTASALELGTPLNSPVIGQPLRVEIPLRLSAGEVPPKADCIRLVLPPGTPDQQFFPGGARVSLASSGALRVVLASPRPVHDPLIEFRLIVGCNSELARDYLILTHPPEKDIRQSEKPETGTTTATTTGLAASINDKSIVVDPPSVPPRPVPPTVSAARGNSGPGRGADTPNVEGRAQTQTLEQETTLNSLARLRYPNSLETRNTYRQLMAQANPSLLGETKRVGSVVLPAGTVLNIPPNLPVPNAGSASTVSPAVLPPGEASGKAPARRTAPTTATGEAGHARVRDRLVIGGASDAKSLPAMAIKEMAVSMERLEQMLLKQSDVEKQLTDHLRSVEETFTSANTQIMTMEASLKRLRAEQDQLLAQSLSQSGHESIGLLGLLALILVAGAGGAGLLVFSHRMQMRRIAFAEPWSAGVPATTDVPRAASKTEAMSLAAGSSEKSATARTRGVEDGSIRDDPSVPATVIATAPRGQLPSFSTSRSVSSPLESREWATSTAVTPLPFVSEVRVATPPPTPQQNVKPVTTARNNGEFDELSRPADEHGSATTPDGHLLFELPECTPEEIQRNLEQETKRERGRTANALPDLDSPESVEDPAVELADIMVSMGLAKEAVASLMQFIADSHTRDLAPWLKALEIYRTTGQREEFQALAESMRHHLNVAPDGWHVEEDSAEKSLEDYPRVSQQLQQLWPSETADAFLAGLLEDNRNGTRAGFPQAVAAEIEFLRRNLRALRSGVQGS